MTSVNPKQEDGPLIQHDFRIRVRYQETDGQGRVHHANYINYFEIGRVEMLRAQGHRYRDLEEQGLLLVVADIQIKYLLPVRYDDEILQRTILVRARGVRLEHRYELFVEDELVVQGTTVVACVNPEGKVTRLPKMLRSFK